MSNLGKKVEKHLKGDIKGYEKERAYLKKEIGEDKELIKVARKKTGKVAKKRK